MCVSWQHVQLDGTGLTVLRRRCAETELGVIQSWAAVCVYQGAEERIVGRVCLYFLFWSSDIISNVLALCCISPFNIVICFTVLFSYIIPTYFNHILVIVMLLYHTNIKTEFAILVMLEVWFSKLRLGSKITLRFLIRHHCKWWAGISSIRETSCLLRRTEKISKKDSFLSF